MIPFQFDSSMIPQSLNPLFHRNVPLRALIWCNYSPKRIVNRLNQTLWIDCKEAIPEVPMVVFRKPKNLAQYLVRARFTEAPKEKATGTSNCSSKSCQICNYFYVGNTFCNKRNGKEFKINYNLDCNSCNIVYLINCKKCQV